jgi:Na+/proline symporter
VSYAVAIVGSAFFFPLLVGMTSKKVSRQAALASSIGGTLAAVFWIVATLMGAEWASKLHPSVVGLAVSGTLMLVVNMMTPPVTGAGVEKFFPEEA